MQSPTGEGLNRVIGIKSLAASVVNLTIGAGIFVLPALVADKLGDASIIAYLICGILIFLIMMCLAEVGSQTTTSGGIYKYVESCCFQRQNNSKHVIVYSSALPYSSYSILTYSFLAFVLSLSGSFKGLAILSSSANLITYFAVVLSLWKLKNRAALSPIESGIRIPKFLIPIILITILWLLSNLNLNEFLALAIFLTVSSLYFFRNAILLWFRKVSTANKSN